MQARYSAHYAKMDKVKEAVSKAYNIGPADIEGRGRTMSVAFVRQVFYYLCVTVYGLNFSRIGGYLDRTHGTVSYGYEQIAKIMQSHSETLVAQVIRDLESKLAKS